MFSRSAYHTMHALCLLLPVNYYTGGDEDKCCMERGVILSGRVGSVQVKCWMVFINHLIVIVVNQKMSIVRWSDHLNVSQINTSNNMMYIFGSCHVDTINQSSIFINTLAC